jgi:DNA-directed RNA polymerase specialized sigma24 family protein
MSGEVSTEVTIFEQRDRELDTHRRFAMGFLAARDMSKDDSEDIVQDVFFKLILEGWEDQPVSLRTILRRRINNRCIDRFRHNDVARAALPRLVNARDEPDGARRGDQDAPAVTT